jgi:carboxyvinyl-carboxyphosphonate phosphorylmutase
MGEPNASAAARLRSLIAGREIVQAPGAYDALSARLVEAAGFPAVYMTGFGSSAALLGRPDVGLLSATEMVDNARRITAAVSIPVIADADTGYGNPLNVMRTVEMYESAGIAGLHIEDQVAPKKCGHMEGKQVIAAEEMIEKIRAAEHARRDREFLIIARTDARAVLGLQEAIDRGRLYVEAGADMLFIEAPENEEECAVIGRSFADVPLLFNWADSGKTPPLPLARIRDLGYRLVIYPISTLLAATHAMQAVVATIKRDGTPTAYAAEMPTFTEFNDFIGLPHYRDLEARFGAAPTPRL